MKNIYLKKAFCGALAAGVAIAGLNAPVQTDAKTTTKKSIDNMSVMSRVVSKNNDGLLRYSYVDENGKPTMAMPYNPNGSLYAIEGITSPDGRILGKMGHTERFVPGLFKNISGNKDQKIFISGVNYFK